MKILAFIESQDGDVKKTGLEIASYSRAIADAKGYELVGVGFNINNSKILESYGVDKFYNIEIFTNFLEFQLNINNTKKYLLRYNKFKL